MYFDSAYIAKYYVNEPDSLMVRTLLRKADALFSSAWALVEVTCVFQRHIREGSLTQAQGQELMALFRRHVESGVWNLGPVTSALLERTATMIRSLPPHVPLRARDAIHIATALDAREPVIWTSDRHLLAAASHFGIEGKSAAVSR